MGEVASRADPMDRAETVTPTSAKGAKLDKQADGEILASGPLAAEDIYTVVGRTKLTGLTGLKIEPTDPSLPKNGPGRANNGNFVLSQLKISVAAEKEPSKSVDVTLDNASADFSQANFTPLKVIDGADDMAGPLPRRRAPITWPFFNSKTTPVPAEIRSFRWCSSSSSKNSRTCSASSACR